MTATAGTADRATLTAVTPNLQIGQFADPALRLAVFLYLFDLSDANWTNVDNRIKDRYTKAQVDAAINAAVIGVVGTPFVQTGTAFPGTAAEGQTFFRADENKYYVYSNGQWNGTASQADIVGSIIYTQTTQGGF